MSVTEVPKFGKVVGHCIQLTEDEILDAVAGGMLKESPPWTECFGRRVVIGNAPVTMTRLNEIIESYFDRMKTRGLIAR